MHEENDFDRVIDEALGVYGEADSGLERRLLARIAAGHTKSPRLGGVVWAAALVATAGLLIAVVLMRARPAHTPDTNARIAPALQQAPKETARVESPATQRVSRLRRVVRPARTAGNPAVAALPKREVFPTPRPLSPEEQALAEFAAHATETERKSFIAAQEHLDEPIAIAAIHIAPIRISPLEPPQPGAN